MTRCLSSRAWRPVLFGTWLVVGIVCLWADPKIQPLLTQAGKVDTVRVIAEAWEELGSTAGIVMYVVAGLALVPVDRGRTLLHFVVSVSAAGIVVQSLKYLIGRVRPATTGDTTVFVGPFGVFGGGLYDRIDSMPSGHTAAAFAMAVALVGRWPRLSWLWIVIAVGVGVSRTIVEAHFPSDVVLGALVGTVVGILINNWSKRYVYGEGLTRIPF